MAREVRSIGQEGERVVCELFMVLEQEAVCGVRVELESRVRDQSGQADTSTWAGSSDRCLRGPRGAYLRVPCPGAVDHDGRPRTSLRRVIAWLARRARRRVRDPVELPSAAATGAYWSFWSRPVQALRIDGSGHHSGAWASLPPA